jgi:cytochrome c-type biogenesis protein CcmH
LSLSRKITAGLPAAAVLVLALVLAVQLILTAVVIRGADAAGTSGQDVAEALTCQCGCGLTVANCNHPNCSFSVPTREKIDTMLAHGMGRAQVIAYFRQQYGEKILSAPTTQGFNLLAWTMPFVALVLGGGMVVLMMGRWRSSSNAASSDNADGMGSSPERAKARPAEEASDSALRERLERELRERI